MSRNDPEDLRLLVEMAAADALSPTERAEVEALISNQPHLRAEYERLRQSASTPTADVGQPGRYRVGGCLLGVIAFALAATLIIVAAILVRSGGDDDGADFPTNPIDKVLDAPNNRVIQLEGPDELAGFGRLALIYADGHAVLLGEEIPQGGELVVTNSDGPNTTVAIFDAGDVKVYIANADPDATYRIQPIENQG